MINEVDWPQLDITHKTQNRELLRRLEKGTKRISKGVQPIFKDPPIVQVKEYLFILPIKHAFKIISK